ncbi:MAG TPA: TonB-dependent receptor plug domain-containing protein [Opitutaceae bacterium]|nr:TonB-dependent receptor plug domain-containing protein [Opitutaceae bacterium]
MRPVCFRTPKIQGALAALALLAPSLALAQTIPPAAPADAPAASAPIPPPARQAAPAAETVVKLSPFEVNSSQDQGYFTANTLAGTRLNTNIGDLAGSITVVTKEQLEDTNSYDINDVMRFEANTEGASTYTPVTGTNATERGNVTDLLSGAGGNILSGQVNAYGNASTAGQRVRGVGSPDNEEDNFFALSRIPFDAYNTQSVEVDRGPNSIIFGSGSPAGIVNQSRAEAVLDKFGGEARVAVSSWGGFRESLNLNVPLLHDTLALYAAQLYDSKGFEQKPSSNLTRRQYVALTANPFKTHKTKIKLSFENYSNYANNPDTITPADYVTPWLASGRPVWNPITETVTYLNTGKTTVPYVLTTTNPNYVAGGPVGTAALTASTSPYFVPAMTFFSGGHIVSFIDQGSYLYTFKGQQTGLNSPNFIPTTLTPAQTVANQELMAESTTLPIPSGYAVWQLPGVVSKGIYDWSSINTNSINHAWTSADTYSAELQQELLPNLNLDLGWFRQELHQTSDDPLGQEQANGIYVDENILLPNGQTNAHVGQPFEDTYQSGVVVAPEINNNLRAMLEYSLNLQDKVPSWLGWLGHHRFLFVDSQHDDVQTQLVYRPSVVGGDANYLPTAAARASSSGFTLNANGAPEAIYYLTGSTGLPNGQATMSPGFMSRTGFGGPTAVPIQTYNYAANAWQTTTLNMAGILTPGGGLLENLQDSKTYFWQSWFWNDRLVGSLGIDDDQVKNRNTVFPTTNPTAVEYNSSGYANPNVWFAEGPWNYIGGNTSTEGLVLHPFKNWSAIDHAADSGQIWAGFLRTLSLTFNKSDNFNPPAAYYTDYFGNPLGKPQGTEKDYGVEIATPDNKLFLRATWFTTSNLNQVVNFTSVARANYIDQNELHNWATAVVEIRNGESPSDPNFGNTSVYPITTAMQGQIAALTGLPYTYGGQIGATGEYVNPTGTQNSQAKGVDLELEYNPLPNWTMKFTWGKQQTTVSNAASQAAAWINYRLPAWQKYAAADLSQVYTLSSGKQMYLGNFWQSYGYDSNVVAGSASGWNTTQLYYQNVVASQLAVDTAVNGTQAANQHGYAWNYLTNYTFNRGPLAGVGLGGALQFTSAAVAGYYGSTTNLNSSGQIAAPNPGAPIYTPSQTHIDLWASYAFRLPWSHLRAKVQLNVADLTSHGYLLPVTFNYDGSPAAERIILPRQYSLTTTVKF